MADHAGGEPSGFLVDLRPQNRLAVAIKIPHAVRQELYEAQRLGKACSLRIVEDGVSSSRIAAIFRGSSCRSLVKASPL